MGVAGLIIGVMMGVEWEHQQEGLSGNTNRKENIFVVCLLQHYTQMYDLSLPPPYAMILSNFPITSPLAS